MIAQDVQSGKSVIYADNSRQNFNEPVLIDEGNFDDGGGDDDYDDEDEDYMGDDPVGLIPAQWPPIASKFML